MAGMALSTAPEHVIADDNSSADDTVLIKLQPFVHQVGGHTCVLQIDPTTICKPHEEREVWFYMNQPEQLKRFTPVFLGSIEVICDPCLDKMCLYGCIPRSLATKRGWRTSKCGNDDMTSSSSGRRGRKRSHSNSSSQSSAATGNQHATDQQLDLNGWSKRCIERQIHRYGFWSNNRAQRFTMLENLVHDYQRPCMMDLKMGRRQFGDDSSLEKRKLLESRCAESTSATLGFRICGMQVYKQNSKSYIVHDKYHGRGLDDTGVQTELQTFYHSGTRLRKDALHATIDRLKELKTYLLSQNALNFFSCSLLLMYEGESPNTDIDTKLVDSVNNSSQGNCRTGTVNRDYSSEDTEDPFSKVNEIDFVSGEKCSTACDRPTNTRIDVRLIDFAHVSEKSAEMLTNDDTKDTIVFGLERLIWVLAQLVQ